MTYSLTQNRAAKFLLTLMTVLFLSFTATSAFDVAHANETPDPNAADLKNSTELAGVTINKDGGKGLVKDGKSLVFLMMAGGFVIIAGCIVVAAIKLAAAGQGQKRTEALMWIGGAFIGAFIVYKAFDLLGYAISFGAG